jgi:hypothetical protein
MTTPKTLPLVGNRWRLFVRHQPPPHENSVLRDGIAAQNEQISELPVFL